METTNLVLTFVILLLIIACGTAVVYWFAFRQEQKHPPKQSKPPLDKQTSTQAQPFRQSQLDISSSKPASTKEEPSPPKPELPPLDVDGEPWRVLVVDDLPKWGEAIIEYRRLLPCDIRHVTSLMSANKLLHIWQPHVILLDLHMPRDDWKAKEPFRHKYPVDLKTLAFCEQVTTDPATANVLIVMTSVEKQAEEQEQALKAGAFRFYTKENFHVVDLEELLQITQASLLTEKK